MTTLDRFLKTFPDSKIAKNYACGKTKSTCILNRAIKPDQQSSLLEHIKNNYFSISSDGSNDQGLSKMNPHGRNFHPKGDGGSGRRPLPPDHLTFDRLNIERVYCITVFELV